MRERRWTRWTQRPEKSFGDGSDPLKVDHQVWKTLRNLLSAWCHDKSWWLSERVDQHVSPDSLSPSVWRDGGCESHFIVWQSRIIWCDRFEMGNQEPTYDAALEAEVLTALDDVRFRSTHEIAEELNEIPWDVARAAHKLVDRGVAPAGAQRDRLRKTPMQEPKPEQPRKGGLLAWMRRLLFGQTK
ncbi:hypothetical protein [Mesorhizobium sp. M0977]|uniref:hypothetical protein n=1 Tax=Mesorhizobium sp. M0977 TaxID=2957039 RepID=UPI00333D6B97